MTPTPTHIAEAERMARAIIQFVSPMNEASCLQYIPKVLAGLDLPQLLASRDECERLRKELETHYSVSAKIELDGLRERASKYEAKYLSAEKANVILRSDRDTLQRTIERLICATGVNNISELCDKYERLCAERDELKQDANHYASGRNIARDEASRLRTREAALMAAMRPENPYPESVFPMTETQYVKAVPNEAQRTAISGLLMRKGWQVYQYQIKEALAKAGVEVK